MITAIQTRISQREKPVIECRKIAGNSMNPLLLGGDLVAVHKVEIQNIEFGVVYFIEFKFTGTEPPPVSRRIINSKKEGTFILRSENEDFEDTEIPIRSIESIYRVIGAIREF